MNICKVTVFYVYGGYFIALVFKHPFFCAINPTVADSKLSTESLALNLCSILQIKQPPD